MNENETGDRTLSVRERLTVLSKAVGASSIYYSTYLLPIIALVVGGWAFAYHGFGTAWPAFVGFVTAIMALGSLPKIDKNRKQLWSKYRFLTTDSERSGGGA